MALPVGHIVVGTVPGLPFRAGEERRDRQAVYWTTGGSRDRWVAPFRPAKSLS